MKKKVLIISVVVFLLDQIIKLIVVQNLNYVPVIPGFLSLTYAENTGVAFSLFNDSKTLIIMISILLTVFLFYLFYKDYVLKEKSNLIKDFSFGLLFGGIFGNLADRILRGVVIDYVSLKFFSYSFPVFNLADVAITLGVILMVIYMVIDDKKSKKKPCDI